MTSGCSMSFLLLLHHRHQQSHVVLAIYGEVLYLINYDDIHGLAAQSCVGSSLPTDLGVRPCSKNEDRSELRHMQCHGATVVPLSPEALLIAVRMFTLDW